MTYEIRSKQLNWILVLNILNNLQLPLNLIVIKMLPKKKNPLRVKKIKIDDIDTKKSEIDAGIRFET